MKKLFLLIVLGIFPSHGFSQIKVRPGVKLSTNISNISNPNLDSKIGFHAGAFAEIKFSSLYAIQPEILYSDQGGKSKVMGVADLSIDYVSVGFANKLYVVPDSGFYLVIGPSFEISIDDSFF